MSKFDINKLSQNTTYYRNKSKKSNFARKSLCLFKISLRLFFSVMVVGIISMILAAICFFVYMTNETENNEILDIGAKKVSLTSFIFVNDDNGNPVEYEKITGSETRIWAGLNEIPQNMQNAIIAIEDKRFYHHHGVDWIRTSSAVVNLFLNRRGHGGSTITQQLVKNLTDDNEVSPARKVREIFRAKNLEKHYSKDDILEAYLNMANFGAGSRGVQAAANIYFGKNIIECSAAECAAIAAVTQNPTANNPLNNPKNNYLRRNLILKEMFEQGMISKNIYNSAIQESENMSFSNNLQSNKNSDSNKRVNPVRNWYSEALYKDVLNDLMEKFKIGKTAAEDILLTHGVKIYCAMDQKTQAIAEKCMKNSGEIIKNNDLESGFLMMDFYGRILATVGSRKPKEGNLLYDRANYARRQPGSIMKPLSTYTPAIDSGLYSYSSIIPDEPLQLPDSEGNLKDWPNNWYGHYKGKVLLNWAIEKSANAPVAQILKILTTKKSFEFLTKKLGFTSLDKVDENSFSALAAGGTHVGVTVREIAAGFQIFGNGGKFYKPYTYFYVTDRNDNIILDNRNKVPINAISSETSTIVNRLLRNVIVGSEGTGKSANISGWDVVGKTGTTNNDYDSWFAGLTPYSVSAIWVGHDKPKRITETSAAARLWKKINSEYLNDKKVIDYKFSENVGKLHYCRETGAIATNSCPSVGEGYYNLTNLPITCTKHPDTQMDKISDESNQSTFESSENGNPNDISDINDEDSLNERSQDDTTDSD